MIQYTLVKVSPPYIFNKTKTIAQVTKPGIIPIIGFDIVILPKIYVVDVFSQA